MPPNHQTESAVDDDGDDWGVFINEAGSVREDGVGVMKLSTLWSSNNSDSSRYICSIDVFLWCEVD